jgi:hypothetical protein
MPSCIATRTAALRATPVLKNHALPVVWAKATIHHSAFWQSLAELEKPA